MAVQCKSRTLLVRSSVSFLGCVLFGRRGAGVVWSTACRYIAAGACVAGPSLVLLCIRDFVLNVSVTFSQAALAAVRLQRERLLLSGYTIYN